MTKSSTSHVDLNSPHILLIEDNAIALRVLENIVSQSFCQSTNVNGRRNWSVNLRMKIVLT